MQGIAYLPSVISPARLIYPASFYEAFPEMRDDEVVSYLNQNA